MNIKDSKYTLLIILGIIIIVGIFIFTLFMDQEEAVAPTINTNDEILATNEILEVPPIEDLTETEKIDAELRDRQRFDDINNIKSALNDYENAKGYYPDTIEEIVPDYLAELPIDPKSESYEYSYTCIGSTDPCVYYDLSYILEIGTEDLPAGMNLESPEVIATP